MLAVGENGCVICPDCSTSIRTGNGGIQNFLQRHQGSVQCLANKKKKKSQEAIEKNRQNALKWFRPQAAIVPSTVATPSLIHPNTSGSSLTTASASANNRAHRSPTLSGCPVGIALLRKFRTRIEGLPRDIGEADHLHPLAEFAGDPVGCVEDGEDAWEKFDGPLNCLLQKPPDELQNLVRVGEKGLIGLCRLLEYLVAHHQVTGYLFEGKLEWLMLAIDKVCVNHLREKTMPLTVTCPRSPLHASIDLTSQDVDLDVDDVDSDILITQPISHPSPIDVDAMDESDDSHDTPFSTLQTCCGIEVKFPQGGSAHSSYPYGIHDELGDPWDYAVTRGVMILRAKGCMSNATPSHKHGQRCSACNRLTENGNLQGVLRRIENGVHENTHLMYHSVGGLVAIVRTKTREVRALRLRKLNDAQKLTGKAVALDNFKQWVMAVGSGKVEHVDRLVKVNLARKGGIRNLLDLHDRAARQVYHPRNYTEEDDLRGLLLWRLGGARVAGIAHCALNLPSLSTLRRRTLIPRLLVSSLLPSRLEVETNVSSNFESICGLIQEHGVTHQVLMLDELKTEERLRHDDKTNKILGVCREHGNGTSLEFNSEKEVDLLIDGVDNNEVHLAVEVRGQLLSKATSIVDVYFSQIVVRQLLVRLAF